MTCYFWWLGKKVRNFAKAIIKNSSSFYRESDDGEKAIKNGTQYEIETSGVVQLEGGFIVEPGAMFAVYPSSF